MSAVIDLHVPDLEARILPGLEAVEDRLHRSVSDSRDLVTELTSHLAQAGGKRMRPLLTLVAAQFGDPQRALSDEVLTAATGIELTHLASLYHDAEFPPLNTCGAITARSWPAIFFSPVPLR